MSRPKVSDLPDHCPECGAETSRGYGFAFGGGLGIYAFCAIGDDECSWFVKHQDPDEEEPHPRKDRDEERR